MKFKLVEDIVKDYKTLTKTEKIDKNNLDDHVVNKIASRNFLAKDEVIEALTEEKILKEDSLEDAAADSIDAEVVTNSDDVKDELNRALATNKRLQRRGKTDGWSNILLTGEAGVGKTARVKQWAAENGINLYIRKAMDLDVTDMGGAITPDKEGKKVNRLTTSEWDPLDRPNSVLFIDELNRAASDVRGQLLTLINNHTISDIHSESGERFLPNMLFTVAAINPSSAGYGVDELDDAEYDRFKEVPVLANKHSLLNFMVKSFEDDIANTTDDEDLKVLKGQLNLTKALLGNKDFEFDTVAKRGANRESGQSKSLSPRTFEAAINNCDGTKEDLLKVWSANCGASSKSMVSRILKNYKDVDDKANDALKTETESELFKKTSTLSDRLRAKRGV